MPPPGKKKPISAFAQAFQSAASETVVPISSVESAPVNETGISSFAKDFQEAAKKKVGVSDGGSGATTSAPSESSSPSNQTETPIITGDYNVATFGGTFKTGTPEPIKPIKDLISQMKDKATVEADGTLTIHDNTEVKSDLPDIKEAIDATVQKNLSRKRGVYDKKLPPPTKDEVQAETDYVTKAYKNGDITPAKDNTGKSVMKRGTGFFGSLVNAVNQVANNNQENDYFSSLSKDEKIKYLNLNQQNPEVLNKEPDTAPAGVAGEIGNFIGENAGMLAKGAVGAMAATAAVPAALATGASNFGSFVSLANEFTKSGYKNSYEKTYYDLKKQGLSDEEAADKAEEVGLVGGATQLAVSGVLSGSIRTPGLEASEPAVNGLLGGVVKSAKDMLKKEAPKMAATSGGASLVESGAEAAVGVDVNPTEALKSAVKEAGHGAVIAAAFWGLHEPLRVPSYLRPQLHNVAASIPVQKREEFLNEAVLRGVMTEEEKINVSKKINEFGETKTTVADLPLPEEKKAAITGKLVQSKKIQEEIDSLTPYGASFSDRIEKLNAAKETIESDINQMYAANDVFSVEHDRLTGEKPVEAAVIMPEDNKPPNIVSDGQETTATGSNSSEKNNPAQKSQALTSDEGSKAQEVIAETKPQINESQSTEKPVVQTDEGTTLISNEPVSTEETSGAAADVNKGGETTKEVELPTAYSKVNNTNLLNSKVFVPKSVQEEAYNNDKNNKGAQSFERIIQRGGYSEREMDKLLPDWKSRVAEANTINSETKGTEKPNSEQTVNRSATEEAQSETARQQKIQELETARDEEVSAASKPDIKLNLVSHKELIAAKDPVAAKEKHDDIKGRYKELKRIVDCL